MTSWLQNAKAWALQIKRDVVALWIAARDARTPVAAKLLAGMVAAYALSPIDLIPDFIPILGYLDDLLIVPLGIMFAIKLIPEALMMEFRASAEKLAAQPTGKAGMIAILVIWLALALTSVWLFVRYNP
jgi:uncharacterized membrane protein YkvA (DUF1232 family)